MRTYVNVYIFTLYIHTLVIFKGSITHRSADEQTEHGLVLLALDVCSLAL